MANRTAARYGKHCQFLRVLLNVSKDALEDPAVPWVTTADEALEHAKQWAVMRATVIKNGFYPDMPPGLDARGKSHWRSA